MSDKSWAIKNLINVLLIIYLAITPKSRQSGCASNPCKNKGMCFDQNDKLVCFCPPGFVGALCEFEYALNDASKESSSGECDRSKCINGTCISASLSEASDSQTSSYCECNRNWSGERCDVFDPCRNPNPCLNNGVCLKTLHDSYVCSCKGGFTGPKYYFIYNTSISVV